MATSQIIRRHFAAKTLRALAKKGINLIGITLIPGTGDLPWATGEAGYQVDDNGTGRVWTFREVIAAAE